MAISHNARFVAIFVVLLAVLGIWILRTRNSEDAPAASRKFPEAGTLRDIRSSGEPALDPLATAAERMSALIRSSLEKFSASPDPETASVILQELRDGLRRSREEAATAAILEFLKSGADAPTGLPFVVGPDGMMDAVPTLRTALLDLLPSLDPLAALDQARELMDQRKSPDEYALALRNLAWNDLDGDLRGELSIRFMDLLKTPWLDQPSAGFLEAFDIAVEVGGGPMFDRLVRLAGETGAKSNTAGSRAAYMALDRMILRDPSILTAAFESDAKWMDFAPQQRASLLSRLDITAPSQREVFQRYVSSVDHSEGELEYFAKLFPNGNYLHGHRLVTTDEETPGINERSAADARVLRELEALEASATGKAAEVIAKIRERLKR